jgi:aerobic-type carbon monoxide dehydrogenase small subunit (CoxS/CutS family)
MASPLSIQLSINGKAQTVSVADGSEPLLYVLRNQFGLHGPKYGCGVAQCGCCTVHINGVITRSCITPMTRLSNGDQVLTLEGFTAGGDGRRNDHGKHRNALGKAFQEAFVEQQAAQCGYCANAMIMGAAGWLQKRISDGDSSVPSEDEIKEFLSGVNQTPAFVYLCRCGTHLRIIRAIQQVAQEVVR